MQMWRPLQKLKDAPMLDELEALLKHLFTDTHLYTSATFNSEAECLVPGVSFAILYVN
jgi:hypothetical protein